jgi:hypothetical protein
MIRRLKTDIKNPDGTETPTTADDTDWMDDVLGWDTEPSDDVAPGRQVRAG